VRDDGAPRPLCLVGPAWLADGTEDSLDNTRSQYAVVLVTGADRAPRSPDSCAGRPAADGPGGQLRVPSVMRGFPRAIPGQWTILWPLGTASNWPAPLAVCFGQALTHAGAIDYPGVATPVMESAMRPNLPLDATTRNCAE
jgi:hypothetical protein